MEAEHLFADEKRVVKKPEVTVMEKETVHTEEEFLLDKSVRCPVCDSMFQTRVIKAGRAMRLQPEQDLRPRFRYVDTNKYDVSSCPNCGYTAINRYFPHLSPVQVRLLREGVQGRFCPSAVKSGEESVLSYETAIERYKLALFSTVVKKGKASEKAYVCLKLSWLYRGWLEQLEKEGGLDAQQRQVYEEEQNTYYEQAYEGFLKAIATEFYPICGMEESTVNLLMANMAFRLKKYDQASHFVSAILLSNAASHKVKDRARDLKEDIIREIRRTNP
jgi:hypothetical protein